MSGQKSTPTAPVSTSSSNSSLQEENSPPIFGLEAADEAALQFIFAADQTETGRVYLSNFSKDETLHIEVTLEGDHSNVLTPWMAFNKSLDLEPQMIQIYDFTVLFPNIPEMGSTLNGELLFKVHVGETETTQEFTLPFAVLPNISSEQVLDKLETTFSLNIPESSVTVDILNAGNTVFGGSYHLEQSKHGEIYSYEDQALDLLPGSEWSWGTDEILSYGLSKWTSIFKDYSSEVEEQPHGTYFIPGLFHKGVGLSLFIILLILVTILVVKRKRILAGVFATLALALIFALLHFGVFSFLLTNLLNAELKLTWTEETESEEMPSGELEPPPLTEAKDLYLFRVYGFNQVTMQNTQMKQLGSIYEESFNPDDPFNPPFLTELSFSPELAVMLIPLEKEESAYPDTTYPSVDKGDVRLSELGIELDEKGTRTVTSVEIYNEEETNAVDLKHYSIKLDNRSYRLHGLLAPQSYLVLSVKFPYELLSKVSLVYDEGNTGDLEVDSYEEATKWRETEFNFESIAILKEPIFKRIFEIQSFDDLYKADKLESFWLPLAHSTLGEMNFLKNSRPTAGLELVSQVSEKDGVTLTFSAESSLDEEGDDLSMRWVFDKEEGVEKMNGEIVEVFFTELGMKNFDLYVEDSLGGLDILNVQFELKEAYHFDEETLEDF